MIFQALQYSLRYLKHGLITGMAVVGMTWNMIGTAASLGASQPANFTTLAANVDLARIEETDCSSFEDFHYSGADVRCGYLIVPENRQNPQSRMIKVAYAIIKAASPKPQMDPIVYLVGGPGDRAINSSWIKWSKESISTRDLILVDPRGVGYSQPLMKCPWKAPSGTSLLDHSPSVEEVRAYATQWAQTCRDLLISQGFDLTSYNSMANANDLEDLRQALGYSQWNLYGISYGTRTALTTMRVFPQGIRSVVLDSLLPPQLDRNKTDLPSRASALAVLFAACKADSACDHDYPNLETKFNEIIERAKQNPIGVSVSDSESGETHQIWLTSGGVFLAISQMLMRPWLIQIAPITIEQIHAGNPFVLERLSASLVPSANQAYLYTVLCQDGGSLFDPDEYQSALDKYPLLKPHIWEIETEAICSVWVGGQAQPEARQPVQSDIPALLITGGSYDSTTPPAFAKLAASTLSHSFLYKFPAYSHAASVNDCPKAMLAAFLDNPDRAPDSSCMAQVRGLPFVSDVYINPGAFVLYVAVQFLNIWLSIAMGVIGLIFLSAIASLPVAYYRSRHRASENKLISNAARCILWLTALLNVMFGVGAWLLVKKALAENYAWVTLFGFSPSLSSYLFILPWLTSILTIVLLAFTFLAWKNRWWGRFTRIYYTFGTLAAVGFVVFLLFSHVLSL